MIFGVCKGIANYTNFSTFWIRVAALIALFMTGWISLNLHRGSDLHQTGADHRAGEHRRLGVLSDLHLEPRHRPTTPKGEVRSP